ncbi:MAG TPA: hypothetical protein VG755_01830 [Nannocystaceae bacterium]|nr:hypothetical protein [Nannocystaceae bacterium]
MRALDRVLEGWLAQPQRVRRGLLALAFYGLGYACAMLLLAFGGARPGTPPWLAIDEQIYFHVEAAFIAPVIGLAAVLAAAILHLVARALGGVGDFDDAVALVGVTTAFASLTTLVPDTVIGVLLCVDVIDAETWMHEITRPSATLALVWVYLAAYLVAFGLGYPAVARVAYRLSRTRALVAGWSSFAIYQLVLYVFVR